MKYLNTYKIFESDTVDNWTTSVEEVKEHFYDLEDLARITIDKFWMSMDLKEACRKEKPGFYPGFVVFVTPTFSGLDFDKYVEYLSGIKTCYKRLPEYFEVFDILPVDSKDKTGYKFVFLDKNYKSISWEDNEIYRDNFLDKFKCPIFRYGSARQTKVGTEPNRVIKIVYVNPVSKTKSNVNMEALNNYISQNFADYELRITQEGLPGVIDDRPSLVKSITIVCLGKKK